MRRLSILPIAVLLAGGTLFAADQPKDKAAQQKAAMEAMMRAATPGDAHKKLNGMAGTFDFTNLFLDLSGKHYASLAQAKAAGAPTINYGVFFNTVLSFLIVAFVVFLIVREVNKMRRGEEKPAAPPVVKECPYCLSSIPIKATRCPHCTSELKAA